ncbi:MAG: hypothetical protein COA50_16085 [Flavobacteriaceae bacterium]|nr:MAG: hypothetical protein COA50_16085 [Flavobacteriaceae bacterium]
MRTIPMTSAKAEEILVKYLTNSITASEFDLLSKWVEEPKNAEEFKTFIKTNYVIDSCMSKYNIEKSKKDLLKKIRKDKKLFYRLNLNSVLKYAAIGILFLGIGYVFQLNFTKKPEDNKMISTEGMVILQLEDGSIETFSGDHENTSENIKDYSFSENEKEKTIAPKELVYNTVKVPYGKRFQVVLSDGTKVHINSGTSLKYPITFIKGSNREVFLNGEAYFDVTKDTEHPFLVNTSELNIRVYGTKFVVSSYIEDANINTVLVEGSVGLFKLGEMLNAKNASMLTPGHKATWDKNEKNIAIEEVDTSIYTEWMRGRITFNHMAFKDILKRLERHYNVSITNYNKQLDEELFTATFDTETIEEVLAAFNKNYTIDYKINKNEILIN